MLLLVISNYYYGSLPLNNHAVFVSCLVYFIFIYYVVRAVILPLVITVSGLKIQTQNCKEFGPQRFLCGVMNN